MGRRPTLSFDERMARHDRYHGWYGRMIVLRNAEQALFWLHTDRSDRLWAERRVAEAKEADALAELASDRAVRAGGYAYRWQGLALEELEQAAVSIRPASESMPLLAALAGVP